MRSSVSLFAPLEKGLQSYQAVKGNIHCRLNGKDDLLLEEGKFLLFDSKAGKVEAQFEEGKECEIYSIVYYPSFYKEWKNLFPRLKIADRLRRFLWPGTALSAPHGSIDAIRELFNKKIEADLQAIFTLMKVKESFLLMLQKDNSSEVQQDAKPRQVQLAKAALAIMLANIGERYTNVQLAEMLNVDRSVLTKAFRRVYGKGMHEYMIEYRFGKAKEMLLNEQSVEEVADAIGYKSASIFSAQFKKYYGYSVSDLLNGSIH
jgi:AraC-like DNA-binding protein